MHLFSVTMQKLGEMVFLWVTLIIDAWLFVCRGREKWMTKRCPQIQQYTCRCQGKRTWCESTHEKFNLLIWTTNLITTFRRALKQDIYLRKLEGLSKRPHFWQIPFESFHIVILPWWDILINDETTWSTAQNRSLVNSPISCGREDAGVTSCQIL